MKRSKLAFLFLFLVLLMVYLLFLKHHYSSFGPSSFRLPPHLQPASHRTKATRSNSSDGDRYLYGIMFDAGSTGTRVHIFRFQMENEGAPRLDHETFRAIKPGLSACISPLSLPVSSPLSLPVSSPLSLPVSSSLSLPVSSPLSLPASSPLSLPVSSPLSLPVSSPLSLPVSSCAGAPRLDHETFRAIKPGLSAYADDPQKCSAGIMELLDVARSTVPPSKWTRTPVVLKATAGLRMLPGEKANKLLDRVRALFQNSPFQSRDDSVSIMEGTDEGISAWITINFLTGGLHHSGSPTVGMLDLGGGSTQITFSPRDEKTIQTSPIDDIRSFQMFNSTHTVYTHSYLGLGLMSARLAILGGVDAPPPGGAAELVSPCLPPGVSGSWEHGEVVYTVKGQKAGEPVYEACLNKVQKVLYRKLTKASEAADLDFYAFSFYYDRAVDLKVIDEKKGGTIRVSDYIQAAERVCGGGLEPQKPFLCLDLVYISVLLQELGLPPHKQLRLARTINQVETSWALGATFQHLESLRRH